MRCTSSCSPHLPCVAIPSGCTGGRAFRDCAASRVASRPFGPQSLTLARAARFGSFARAASSRTSARSPQASIHRRVFDAPVFTVARRPPHKPPLPATWPIPERDVTPLKPWPRKATDDGAAIGPGAERVPSDLSSPPGRPSRTCANDLHDQHALAPSPRRTRRSRTPRVPRDNLAHRPSIRTAHDRLTLPTANVTNANPICAQRHRGSNACMAEHSTGFDVLSENLSADASSSIARPMAWPVADGAPHRRLLRSRRAGARPSRLHRLSRPNSEVSRTSRITQGAGP